MLYIENLKRSIDEKLKIQNLSVNGLERKLGVSKNAIRKILMGEVKNPTLETLVALANIFDSSIDSLILGKEEKNSLSLTNNIWDNKLMGEIFKETCYFICDHKIEPNFKIIFTFMLEMYHYFSIENKHIFDKQFFDWRIKKELIA